MRDTITNINRRDKIPVSTVYSWLKRNNVAIRGQSKGSLEERVKYLQEQNRILKAIVSDHLSKYGLRIEG